MPNRQQLWYDFFPVWGAATTAGARRVQRGLWVAVYNAPLASTGWQGLGAALVFLPVDIDGVTRVVAEFSNAGQFLIDDLTDEGVAAVDGATWGTVKGLFR